jgi:hypothetical protein
MANRGKAVFGVNAAISVALVVLVAAVALVVRPPAPPGIAAFAPQAAKPITKAPPGQSSVNGTGSGACATGQRCQVVGPKPTPTRTAVAVTKPSGPPRGVPSALQCYTWPDGTVTQTFDPQSPPCIASWPDEAKGNGGTTSTGVSGTTIKVAFPKANSTVTQYPKIQPLVDFFNTHFQLYGRHLQLVPFTSAEATYQAKGTGSSSNPSNQKADAEGAAQLHPFAALDFVDPSPFVAALPSYLDSLAKRGVIGIAGGGIAPVVSDADLGKHAPYEWTYHASSDAVFQATAELTCRQLVGRRASHATSYVAATRKFAVVLPATSLSGSPLAGQEQFFTRLAACGITKPDVVTYTDANEDAGALSASFLQLKNKGVTSLLFYPWLGAAQSGAPQKTASNTGYHPEWITMGYSSWTSAGLQGGAADQTKSTFGVATWSKQLPLGQTPWVQAFTSGGGSAPTAGSIQTGDAIYHELLMLASGVQMAGPHLTPETFAAALQSTSFPNPGAATAPSYQGHVGFAADHTMMDDLAAWWFDPSSNGAAVTAEGLHQAMDTYDQFCFVGLGSRWRPGSWPTTDRFFQPGCR